MDLSTVDISTLSARDMVLGAVAAAGLVIALVALLGGRIGVEIDGGWLDGDCGGDGGGGD